MSDQIKKVIAYYKSTNFDYEHFWSGRRALALHFGYYNSKSTRHEESLLNMNRVLAEIAQINKTDKVLDAGCGYGGSAIWLSENIGCEVTGITVVPYQVQKARKHAAASSASTKLSFVEEDYMHTKLSTSSFNVVWGLESIVHCENKGDFIIEASRLLKPGGRLIISEYMLREVPPLSAAEHKRMTPFLKGWIMPELLSPMQYMDLFTEAGFETMEIHDLSNNVEPSLKKCHRNASFAMPFVGILRKLKLIDAIRKDYTVANYELYNTFKDGLCK